MRKEDRRKEETGLHDPIKTCCRAIEMINKGERERKRKKRGNQQKAQRWVPKRRPVKNQKLTNQTEFKFNPQRRKRFKVDSDQASDHRGQTTMGEDKDRSSSVSYASKPPQDLHPQAN